MTAENHVERDLKRRLKQVNATMGKQGQTIHQLRADIAELRELHSKIDRGDVRRLERENANLVEARRNDHDTIAELRNENKNLRDKIEHLDRQIPVTDARA